MKIKFYKRKHQYKYELAEQVEYPVPILGIDYHNGYLDLWPDGMLTIRKCYAWDGPSGPTWDDNTNMVGSLIHDALYQLMRCEVIGRGYRPYADKLLHDICIHDGMNETRADLWFWGVRKFASFAAKLKKKEQKVYEAGL